MKIINGTWDSSNDGDWTGEINFSFTSAKGAPKTISAFYKYSEIKPSKNKAKVDLYIDTNKNGAHDKKDKVFGSQKSKYSTLSANPTADQGTFTYNTKTGKFKSYYEGTLYGTGSHNSFGKKLFIKQFNG